MQRTIKIKLQTNPTLINTIKLGNEIFKAILQVGFSKKTYNKKELHKRTYKKLRKKYPQFPSALIQTVRDVASEALKATKLKKWITAKNTASLRLDKRNLRVDLLHRRISISSIEGRLKLRFGSEDPERMNPQFERYADWKPVAGTLVFKDNRLYLNLVVEKKTSPPKLNPSSASDFLGIDRGINNILTCSNNQFFNSTHLRKVKGEYQYQRKVLQSKGTPSARRKLKKIAGRERRFVSDINHRLSKAIAESDYKVFVLEDLHKMTNRKKGRKFNRKLGNWSFRQFGVFLEYKADALGKRVLPVNPRYTSQMCSRCGHREKLNRKRANFRCRKCLFELHADLNAARNIAMLGISEFGRLTVNQPKAGQENWLAGVTPDELHQQGGQLQADQFIGR
jgi:IS605 OrfB family transposase